jgi:hypothetical protein
LFIYDDQIKPHENWQIIWHVQPERTGSPCLGCSITDLKTHLRCPLIKEHEMATATLASLKLTAAQKSTSINPVQQRRNKMGKRLWEQIQLAKAKSDGSQFNASKFRTIVDSETGLRKQIEVPKRVKAWWFTTDSGKTAITVRYGARVLELAKGKFAIEVANPTELVPTLEIIKAAIEAGELDVQLEATASTVRNGFGR